MASDAAFSVVCEELDRRRHITLGLERMEELLALLGRPQRDLRAIQVVGTNGKGTTAVALAASLEAAGHPSGAYLSPHVLSYTERLVVGGRPVSEHRFADVMLEVIQVADDNGVPASQFELLTAGALKMFRDAGLSFAVLEAGLGARYDATSAGAAQSVVLTNVGLDHTEYLGETIEEIATEKLASLRGGGTLVLGTGDPRVVGLAREECKRLGARLVEVSGEPALETGSPEDVAPYTAHNIRVGVRAAEIVLEQELGPEIRGMILGVIQRTLPGRFEVHEVRGVPVIVDGGHNVAGLQAAIQAVRNARGEQPLGVVFGVLRDKDIARMLPALKGEACLLVLTRPANERAAEPEWIASEYAPRDCSGRRARVVEDAVEAVETAVEQMEGTGGAVLATGSLSVGADVLRWLREG